jgi:hypothetical protein
MRKPHTSLSHHTTPLLPGIWKASESHLEGILAFQMPFRYGSDAFQIRWRKKLFFNPGGKKRKFVNICRMDFADYRQLSVTSYQVAGGQPGPVITCNCAPVKEHHQVSGCWSPLRAGIASPYFAAAPAVRECLQPGRENCDGIIFIKTLFNVEATDKFISNVLWKIITRSLSH